MANVAVLLDKVRNTRSIASDNALALSLHVTRQTVSQWRHGDAYPDEDRIAQLAELAGEDAGGWLLLMKAERTEGRTKKAYQSLVKQLGIAAMLGIVLMPGSVYATHLSHFAIIPGLSIMSTSTRLPLDHSHVGRGIENVHFQCTCRGSDRRVGSAAGHVVAAARPDAFRHRPQAAPARTPTL